MNTVNSVIETAEKHVRFLTSIQDDWAGVDPSMPAGFGAALRQAGVSASKAGGLEVQAKRAMADLPEMIADVRAKLSDLIVAMAAGATAAAEARQGQAFRV